MSDKDRAKALEVAISQIEKQFGKGAIMRLGSEGVVEIPAISTGSIGLDAALGVGGFPRGRVIEIYGPESSGKTTLALSAVAQAHWPPRWFPKWSLPSALVWLTALARPAAWAWPVAQAWLEA